MSFIIIPSLTSTEYPAHAKRAAMIAVLPPDPVTIAATTDTSVRTLAVRIEQILRIVGRVAGHA